MEKGEFRKIDLLLLLIRPVVRFALRHGIRFQETAQMLKLCFIEEAERTLTRSNQKINKSRLSAVTGLQRKDLQKLPELPLKTDLITKVVGHWSLSKSYTLQNGKPKKLSFEGLDSEFSRLVQAVSTDLHPGTVMFELERMGLVEKKNGNVLLVSRVIDLGNAPIETFTLVSKNSDDLIRAVEQNIFDEDIRSQKKLPNLHAATEFTRIDLSKVDSIRKWLLVEGSRFQKKVREYLAGFDLDITPSKKSKGEKGARVCLGTFGIVDTEDE